MKPRIEEIARKLGVKPDPSGNMFITNGREFNDLERFAELIVRECAEQVDWILAEGGQTQGDKIKQHFGVES
jgi:hypothetical protein